jgi:hypothetical protein
MLRPSDLTSAAKEAAEKSSRLDERPSWTEARSDSGLLTARLETAPFQNGCPDSSFLAACEADIENWPVIAALKRCATRKHAQEEFFKPARSTA